MLYLSRSCLRKEKAKKCKHVIVFFVAVSATSNAKSKSTSESSSSSYDILRQQLKIALNEISRQKLRNIQIHMRRIANVDCRVKSWDLWEVFMEHGFPINKRTFQLLMEHFSDSFGVEYESIVKLLKDTHARTGS